MSASNIPFTVSGGVVLVTGAAMGMGRLYALRAARLGKVLRGVLPVRSWDFVGGKIFGIYSGMDTFTGRTAGTSSKAGPR
jgi:all-trans-retinol dehydrogenase (NAD+)